MSPISWSARFHTALGRQHETTQVEAGTVTLRLRNMGGEFSPFNTASVFYGPFTDGGDSGVLGLVPGKRIRIRATWSGVTYTVWSGFIATWPMVWPDEKSAFVDITAVDALKNLNLIQILSAVDMTARGMTPPPSRWYRMGEPPRATAATESFGTGIYGTYQGGAACGQPPLAVSDPTTSTFFSYLGGERMVIPDSPQMFTGGAFSLACTFQTGPAHRENDFQAFDTATGTTQIRLAVLSVTDGSAGQLQFRVVLSPSSADNRVVSTVVVDNGSPHRTWLRPAPPRPVDPAMHLYVDGVDVGTRTLSTAGNWVTPYHTAVATLRLRSTSASTATCRIPCSGMAPC